MSVEAECKCVRDNIAGACKCESVEEAECCGNCRCWLSYGPRTDDREPRGVCRAHPPVVVARDDYDLPESGERWWCGEWKAK